MAIDAQVSYVTHGSLVNSILFVFKLLQIPEKKGTHNNLPLLDICATEIRLLTEFCLFLFLYVCVFKIRTLS